MAGCLASCLTDSVRETWGISMEDVRSNGLLDFSSILLASVTPVWVPSLEPMGFGTIVSLVSVILDGVIPLHDLARRSVRSTTERVS